MSALREILCGLIMFVWFIDQTSDILKARIEWKSPIIFIKIGEVSIRSLPFVCCFKELICIFAAKYE